MPCMRTWFVMVDYRFNTAVLRTPRVRRWQGWRGGHRQRKIMESALR